MHLKIFAALTLSVFMDGAAFAAPMPSAGVYLKPDLKVGEKLEDVYSKSVSIRGDGFQAHVARYSGISEYTITAVTADAIVADEIDQSDGQPPSPPVHGVKFVNDGVTNCYKGKCAPNNQTSGLLFNTLLWGHAPSEVHPGSTWSVKVDKSWEIGPAGDEQVRVMRIDPLNGEITLTRWGNGEGASSDELRLRKKPLEITTSGGRQLVVDLIPGKAKWSGYTTVHKGVIVGDEIMLKQQVKLVAKDGTTFNGELRVYTLLDLARDSR